MNSDVQSPRKTLLGCLLLPFTFLFIPVIVVLNWLGWNKLNAKPEYVIEYLEKFTAGTEGRWDWDDFSSIPLADPRLENIRERACQFGPWTRDDIDAGALQDLLEEARALQRKSD